MRPARLTFAEYLESWLDGLALAGRRETTITGYRRIVHLHLNPAIGQVQLQQLTALHLDRLDAELAVLGPAWHDRVLVFANPLTGLAWHPDSIGQAFARPVATFDVPGISGGARAPIADHGDAARPTALATSSSSVAMVSFHRFGSPNVAITPSSSTPTSDVNGGSTVPRTPPQPLPDTRPGSSGDAPASRDCSGVARTSTHVGKALPVLR